MEIAANLVIDARLNAHPMPGMKCYKEGKGHGEIVSLGDARREVEGFSARKADYDARIAASGLDDAPVFRISSKMQYCQRLVRDQAAESDETLFFVFGRSTEKVS